MIITTRCLKITQKGPKNIGIAPKLRSSLRSQSCKMRHFVVIFKHCELQVFIDVLENKYVTLNFQLCIQHQRYANSD